MLSIRKCRELLGLDSDDLSDQEIENLREQLYGLASLALSQFSNDRRIVQSESNVLDFRSALRSFVEGERDSIAERAAIMEVDGKLSRGEAERAAIAMTLRGSAN